MHSKSLFSKFINIVTIFAYIATYLYPAALMASDAQERCPTNVFRIVLPPEVGAPNYQDVLSSLTASGITANQDSKLNKVLDKDGQLIGYSGYSAQIGEFLYKADESLILTGKSDVPLNTTFENLKSITIAKGASRRVQQLNLKRTNLTNLGELEFLSGSIVELQKGTFVNNNQVVVQDVSSIKASSFINYGKWDSRRSSYLYFDNWLNTKAGVCLLNHSSLKVKQGQNMGRMHDVKISVAADGKFTNLGPIAKLVITGAGNFINHNNIEDLEAIDISDFSNVSIQRGSAAVVSGDEITIDEGNLRFVNGEDSKFSFKNLIIRSKSTHEPLENKGLIEVTDTLSSVRTINNEGELFTGKCKLSYATLRNMTGGTFKGSLSFIEGSHLINEIGASLETTDTLHAHMLKSIAQKNAGLWQHNGDVEIPDKEIIIRGKVKFIGGHLVGKPNSRIQNKGDLTIESVTHNPELIRISNSGTLTISDRDCYQRFAIKNIGKLVLHGFRINEYDLVNRGKVLFKNGRYLFTRLQNFGHLDFAEGDWRFACEENRSALTFDSVPVYSLSSGRINLVPLVYYYQNAGSIKVKGKLNYGVGKPFGKIDINGDLTVGSTIDGRSVSLTDLKGVVCSGATTVRFADDLYIREDLDLTAIATLARLKIECPRTFHLLANLITGPVEFEGGEGFHLGQDNAHFGSWRTVGGHLTIRTQTDLYAKYGTLQSDGKMTLHSVGGRVEGGAAKTMPYDAKRGLGYIQSDHGSNSTNYYELNGSRIWANEELEIVTPNQALLNYVQLYSGKTLTITTPKLTITRAILEGCDHCLLKSDQITINNAGTLLLGISWTEIERKHRKNRHGHKTIEHARSDDIKALLSEGSSLNFLGDVCCNGNDISVLGSEIFARRGIFFNNLQYDPAIAPTGYSAKLRIEPVAGYRTLPSTLKSGTNVTVNTGFGVQVNANITSGAVNIRGTTVGMQGDGAGQIRTSTRSVETDLTTLMNISGSRVQRLADGSFAPIFPTREARFPGANELPVLRSSGAGNFPSINLMGAVPYELVMQRALADNIGCMSRQFNDFLLAASAKFREEHQESGDNQTLQQRIQNSPDFLLYIVEQVVGQTVQQRHILHAPVGVQTTAGRSGIINATDNLAVVARDKLTANGIAADGVQSARFASETNSVDLENSTVGSSKGTLTIESALDIIKRGVNLFAGEDIVNTAKRDIITLTLQRYREWQDGKDGKDKHIEITHQQGHETAGRRIVYEAEGHVVLQAPILRADEGISVKGQGGVALLAANNMRQNTVHSGKGKNAQVESSMTSDVVQCMLQAPNIAIDSAHGSVEIVAAILKSVDSLDISAPEDRVLFRTAIKDHVNQIQRSKSGAWTDKSKSEGCSSSTHVDSTIEGPLRINASSVEVERRAANMEVDDILNRVLKQLDEETGKVRRTGVHDNFDSWKKTTRTLGAASKLLIAIAVSLITCGTGMAAAIGGAAAAGLGGGATAAAVGAGVGAAAVSATTSLAVNTATAAYNNKGHIGRTLKEVHSKENLRSAAVQIGTAAVTAGVLKYTGINTDPVSSTITDQGKAFAVRTAVGTAFNATLGRQKIGEAFFTSARSGGTNGANDFAGAAVNILRDTIINAGANMVIDRSPAREALKDGIKTALINEISAQCAKGIKSVKGVTGEEIHKLLHGVLGATYAMVETGDRNAWLPGAAAGIGAEIAAEMCLKYGKPENIADYENMSQEQRNHLSTEIETLRQQAIQLGKLAGVLTAVATGRSQDAELYARIGQNAAEHNAVSGDLLHDLMIQAEQAREKEKRGYKNLIKGIADKVRGGCETWEDFKRANPVEAQRIVSTLLVGCTSLTAFLALRGMMGGPYTCAAALVALGVMHMAGDKAVGVVAEVLSADMRKDGVAPADAKIVGQLTALLLVGAATTKIPGLGKPLSIDKAVTSGAARAGERAVVSNVAPKPRTIDDLVRSWGKNPETWWESRPLSTQQYAELSALRQELGIVVDRTVLTTRVPMPASSVAAHTSTPVASESRTTTASPSSWKQKGKMRDGTEQTYAESRAASSGSQALSGSRALSGMDGVSMTTSRVTTALSGLDHIGSAGSRNATWHASVATNATQPVAVSTNVARQAVGATNATRTAAGSVNTMRSAVGSTRIVNGCALPMAPSRPTSQALSGLDSIGSRTAPTPIASMRTTVVPTTTPVANVTPSAVVLGKRPEIPNRPATTLTPPVAATQSSGSQALSGLNGIAPTNGLRIVRDSSGQIASVTNTQKHHIIHRQLGDHPLWELAGRSVNERANTMLLPTVEGAQYTTTSRTIHQGSHTNVVVENLRDAMGKAVERGATEGWSKARYSQEVDKIILKERLALKGNKDQLGKALNKHDRSKGK